LFDQKSQLAFAQTPLSIPHSRAGKAAMDPSPAVLPVAAGDPLSQRRVTKSAMFSFFHVLWDNGVRLRQ
jgi:hypothetical protein